MTDPTGSSLRMLSLNIQVGLETRHYRQYVTKAWRHLVPTRGAYANLERTLHWLPDMMWWHCKRRMQAVCARHA